MAKQAKQSNVVALAPVAKPEFVKAIATFAKARTTLAAALEGADRQDVVAAVGAVTKCPLKPAVGGKALTAWVLDSKHTNYEGAKTLLRDVVALMKGDVSRGTKQGRAKKAANKVVKPEDVVSMYLELDAKGRAAFRKLAKLQIAK